MVIHINTYGHMQLDSLTVETNLLGTVHVLSPQDEPLYLLLAVITTVILEYLTIIVQTHTTSPTHCGTVQVVLLTIHVVSTLTNHSSIIG